MSFPLPEAGLVIRYSYLWKREALAGQEEGAKDRPCAIVLAVLRSDDEYHVIVLPITHSEPEHPEDAIEIPAITKNRLGLDAARSWVVITESNAFEWPGPDLRFIPGREEKTVTYGPLPPKFMTHVRDRFLERYRLEKASPVQRTE